MKNNLVRDVNFGRHDDPPLNGAGASPAPHSVVDEIDLGQLLRVLWSGKLWIMAATMIGIGASALVIANTHPTYQADALLQLEQNVGSLSLPSSLAALVDAVPLSVTEMEILRSRTVLGRAVAARNLGWRVAPDHVPFLGTMFSRYRFAIIDAFIPVGFARPGERITLENLDVPSVWLNQAIELTVLSEIDYEIVLPDSQRLVGVVGVPLVQLDTGMSLTIATLAAPAGRRFSIRQLDESLAINNLRQRVAIIERARASGILEVRLAGEDPIDTIRTLDAIVQAYLDQNVAFGAAEAESSLAFIQKQLPQAEGNLREAEAALNTFRQQQAANDPLLDLQTFLRHIPGLEGELAELQRREASLRDTPANPSYRKIVEERGEIETRLAAMRPQVAALRETERQILNLTRTLELAQQVYTDLQTRAQEVEVLRARAVSSVRILDMASADPFPVAPNKKLILIIGMLLGAFAGTGAALIRNWLRRGIQDSTELEKLGLPVFATINRSKDAEVDAQRKGALPILASAKNADVTVECLRSLRTSLHFSMRDAKTPTITITSSDPEVGKSFVAVNLAVVAAQAGQRVCLVDADLRRGQLARYFDLPRNHRGLADVLSGEIAFDQAVVQTRVGNLFFMSTGRYPSNPSELLMRAELPELVEWCANNFDLTIFDSPPILAVTDPVILARSTGLTILVARHDTTHIGEVEAALKVFAASGLRMSGAVLNAFDPRKAPERYGYSRAYRYEYRQRKQ